MPPAPIIEEHVTFLSEGLTLEGVLAYPEEASAPGTAVLFLAPHPHLGGDMDNNVIRHLARRAAEDGCVTLRFNYRGVGESEIALPGDVSLYTYWADMEREQRYEILLPDASSAAEFLEKTVGAAHWALAGYSLGAVLAGMLGSAAHPDRILAISPPVQKVSLEVYTACHLPKTFIGGDAGFAFDPGRFAEEYAPMPEPKAYVHLLGTDHFYRGEEEHLYRAAQPFLLHGKMR